MSSAPCAIVLTAPVLGFPGAIAINRNALHPYAAALLADWVLSDEAQHLLARFFRGPIALAHPYLPDDTPVVLYGLTGQAVVDKVLSYWGQYVDRCITVLSGRERNCSGRAASSSAAPFASPMKPSARAGASSARRRSANACSADGPMRA
jgi:hypothetical protein